MIKITGLDKLRRQLSELQRGFESLDGPITEVKFNPESFQKASIQQFEKWNVLLTKRQLHIWEIPRLPL